MLRSKLMSAKRRKRPLQNWPFDANSWGTMLRRSPPFLAVRCDCEVLEQVNPQSANQAVVRFETYFPRTGA